MGPLDLSALPPGALVLVDAAPIIHVLEAHPSLAARFHPLFERQASGIAVNADALVTHDRDFSKVRTLAVLR